MDWLQPVLTFVGVVVGSGLIQFLITRKDNKDTQIETIKKELKEGLDAREAKGLERYTEHREEIEKLNQAIFQLTKNDTAQSEFMQKLGDALIGLSHDRLIYLSDICLERGSITRKEQATIESIYNPYSKLGGNGDCHVAYERIGALPIISEEDAKKLDRERKYRELHRVEN